MKKIVIGIIFCTMLLLSLVPAKESFAASKISSKTLILQKGQKKKLKIKGIKKKTVKWISNKKSIATVSKKGVVKAKNYGKTTIIAKVKNKKYRCKVTVAKPYLNNTSLTLQEGQTYQLQLNDTREKIQWYSTDPSVATVSSDGLVFANTQGETEIIAQIDDERYVCSVIVKWEYTDNRLAPISGYQSFTSDIYEYDEYLGNFTIQLLDFKGGQGALDYLSQYTTYNLDIAPNEEYIYLKYAIKYNHGAKEVEGIDVINHYSNIYNKAANIQLDNHSWTYPENGIQEIGDVSLYPGGSAVCQKAIVVDKGSSPVTYRIQVGYDQKHYQKIYRWFTTAK